MPSAHRGRVTMFGGDGWGVVTDESGVAYPFHCTAISDGSRTIQVDSPVTFTIVAGRQGRWEAAALALLSG